jgi:hypothetical protein
VTKKGDYRRNGGFTQALSFILCGAAMLLDGCASTPISLRKTLNTPVRIVVVQEPMTDQATDNAVKGIASDLSRAFAVNPADREQQSQ